MKLKTLLVAVLLASTTLLSACASYGNDRGSREVISDSTVTTKVKAALLTEKDVNSFDIGVKTFEGTVQLSGFVDSQWQIDKAVQVASAVHGVKHVKNDLSKQHKN